MKKRALNVLAACILLFSACSAGGQELPPDQYRRLTAFLARRGYPYEAVRRVMAQLEE